MPNFQDPDPEESSCLGKHAAWDEYPESAWEQPSKAVVACRQGYGIVLWTAGPHVNQHIEELGVTDLGELGLDDAPDGITVWEGMLELAPYGHYPPDVVKHELRGAFRQPTDTEWAAIRNGECPWNDNDWLVG